MCNSIINETSMKPVKGGSALDKKKTKELDWHIKWDYLLNKKKWKNPDEVNKVLTKFVEDLLTQQRTELLEEILNLECIKEEKETIFSKRLWLIKDFDDKAKNQLRKEIKEQINNLKQK